MSKLTKSNPYYHDPIYGPIWELGFATRQKSTLTPLSVTGRWWQVQNGNIYFINKKDYKPYEQTTNSVIGCQWITEEETREFE